jgi:hypothetical protein
VGLAEILGRRELLRSSGAAMQRTLAEQLKEHSYRAMDRQGRCQQNAWCDTARRANHSVWMKLTRQAGLWFVAAAVISAPAAAQQQQPFSDDTVTQLVTAALHQYFDSASVFEISVSGSTQVGDLLRVQDLLIVGKPAVFHSLRGELLAHISGLEVDIAALTNLAVKVRRIQTATVVAKTTSTAIQDALSRFSASLINPRIQLQSGSFTLTTIIRRNDALYPTVAHGALAVVQGQQVHLVLTDVTVSGSNVPVDLVGSELARINPLVDLAKYPIALFVDRLVLHNDGVELLATNRK